MYEDLGPGKVPCHYCPGIARQTASRFENRGPFQQIHHRTYRCGDCRREWTDSTDGS